jgi:hypothetical protein
VGKTSVAKIICAAVEIELLRLISLKVITFTENSVPDFKAE